MSRLPWQPRDGRQPIFNAPPATVWLCSILIAMFVAFNVLPYAGQEWVFRTFAFKPLLFLSQFADSGPGILPGRMMTLVSYAFLHADFMHILVNVGLLLAFGSLIERLLGATKFLIIFFTAAAGGALAMTWAVGASPIEMIGASGAVYGLIGAATRFLFAADLSTGRRGALGFIAVLMGLNVLMALVGWGGLVHGVEIAWEAHVGGFVFGLALGPILVR